MTLVDQVNNLAVRTGTEFKTVRTELANGLAGRQPSDATLTALAALVVAANKMIYATGADAFATTDLTAFARTLLDDVDAATMRGTLGLGTAATQNVGAFEAAGAAAAAQAASQPLDADLTAIAALASAANKLLYATGAGTWALADLTAAARTVLDDPDVATMRATLGAEATANKGVAGGYASLDGTGRVPLAQIPNSLEDIVEVANAAALPGGGGTPGTMYITIDNNHEWRWSGSVWVDLTAAGGPANTDQLAEGAVNLYYTQARTDARINALLDAQMGNEATDFVATFNAALI